MTTILKGDQAQLFRRESMVVRKARRLTARFRHEGILQTLWFFLDACRPGQQQILFLGEQPAEVPVPNDLQTLHSGNSCLREHRYPGLPETYYRDELANGVEQRCFVALWDGQLAGVLWIFQESHPSQYLDLKATEAELGGAHVLPRFRGRGVFRSLIHSACTALREEGFFGIYAVVDERNSPSRAAFEACGFRYIGGISRPLANLFGLKFHPHRS